MKLLGAMLVVFSGLLWGGIGVSNLKKRERLLLDLKKMMQSIKTNISYSSRPLPELLYREDSCFCQKAAKEGCFLSDPCGALINAGETLLSKREDKDMYSGFVQGLGISDTQGQLEHISLYSSLLDDCIKNAKAECSEKSKLYLSLGLFMGITLCIILL